MNNGKLGAVTIGIMGGVITKGRLHAPITRMLIMGGVITKGH